MGILSNIVIGYDNSEDLLIANIIMCKNIIIIGKHGVGKTILVELINKSFNDKSRVQYYDCTKASMINVCGIPNTEKMKVGEFVFVSHDSTIWNKDVVILDEITRANKENQSMWMELLEHGTMFGIPTNCKCIVATCNPQTYAATYSMDEAVWDRFDTVIIAPDFQTKGAVVGDQTIRDMIRLNLMNYRSRYSIQTSLQLQEVSNRVKMNFEKFKNEDSLLTSIEGFVSKLLEVLLIQEKTYISPRTFAKQLPEQILILYCYYSGVLKHEDALIKASEKALIGTLINKLKIDAGRVLSLHTSLKNLLLNGDISKKTYMLVEYSKCSNLVEQIEFLKKDLTDLIAVLDLRELDVVLGNLYQRSLDEGRLEILIDLQQLLIDNELVGELIKKVNGDIYYVVNNKLVEIECLVSQLKMNIECSTNLESLIQTLKNQIEGKDNIVIRRFLSIKFTNEEDCQSLEEKLSAVLG